MIVALAGGVGASKFLEGLSRANYQGISGSLPGEFPRNHAESCVSADRDQTEHALRWA